MEVLMRTLALLMGLAIVAFPSFAADKPATLPAPNPDQSNFTLLRDRAAIDNAALIHPETPDGACFKMRTYVMEREGAGDATRLVKYYTCQKASKFGVKRAQEEPQEKR